MQEVEVCPIKIYKFEAESTLVDSVFNDITNIRYQENKQNLISEELFYHKELTDWFDICIEEVRKIKYPRVQQLVITSCWANKTTKLHLHHEHRHPNSLLSGVFYLTSHESGEIAFLNNDKWYDFDNNFLNFFNEPSTNLITKIKPSSGMLLLFPSNLKHRTTVLKESGQVRFSISFNTFITGTLNAYSNINDKDDISSGGINQVTFNTLDYRKKLVV